MMVFRPATKDTNLLQVPTTADGDKKSILFIARRMFEEGFTKSMIKRITGLTEDEFIRLIKEI